MPDRESRSVRVDPDVWTAFREQIDEWDGENPGHVGYHVEEALKEYIDRDRYARIEDKLDSVLGHVSDGGGTHTHTPTATASDTVERAGDIHRRVVDNHGTVIRDDDLVRAVEDIAGADDRTVRKYKGILKRRSLLFEHPANSPVWTADRQQWVSWVENHVDNDPTLSVLDVIDNYDITAERYDELVAKAEVENAE
jgi:hypothetical protein